MSAKRAARQRVPEADSSSIGKLIKTLIDDLEGVERLQQMQSQLMREVIRELKKLAPE